MKFTLNTVRKIDNDQTKEHAFGSDQSLEEHLAVCFINPKDFDNLNLVPSLHLKIANNEKEIVVKVEKDENVHEGIVIMPVSIWSNQLTEVQSNEILYKNISVDVEATRDPVTNFNEIMEKLGVKK
ncbi:MAG: molybdopterin dinucleotide binding domain-containing protein [Candidatus Hermodarchaeota archaeon]